MADLTAIPWGAVVTALLALLGGFAWLVRLELNSSRDARESFQRHDTTEAEVDRLRTKVHSLSDYTQATGLKLEGHILLPGHPATEQRFGAISQELGDMKAVLARVDQKLDDVREHLRRD